MNTPTDLLEQDYEQRLQVIQKHHEEMVADMKVLTYSFPF